MKRYRGVIFDLDGTLIDSFGPITTAANAACEDAGVPPVASSVVRRLVGRGLETLVADLVGSAHVDRGVRRFRQTYEQIYLDQTTTIDGARDAVLALAGSGVRIAVASNKPARFARPIVRKQGLAESIEIVLGPDEDIPTKPDPAMLDRAVGELGLAREECVYVGDMPLDVETARRARLDHLLVPSGSWSTTELLDVEGARIIPNLSCLQMFTVN